MKRILKQFLASLGYAIKGIFVLVKEEQNAHIHFAATVIVIIAGIYFNISTVEWTMVLFAIGIVWVAEAINTAIENTLDFINASHHPKIGKIKDISAGAVLIAALISISIASFVFWDEVI